MANTIFQILSHFFARYGYGVVFFGVMLENVGLPIPGETVLLFAGFLAYRGQMRILPAILTAIAGATLGACLGFLIGRYAGVSVVERLHKRFPRIARRYDAAQIKFQKHGKLTVFAARFITGVRVFAGILAGALRMPFPAFLAFSFAGAVCWAFVIGYVGFVFGSSWNALVSFVGRMDRILLVIIAVIAAVWLAARWIRPRKVS